ncbi:hypothetical protein LC607_05905 [Nostoc sp. CHAB 5824]|nr:hypothetical protein [Nostoc sp. CHAB 5824]
MKQLEDKKLLERYKAGERDFCNFAFDPETRKVLIASELMNSYKDILGKRLENRLCGEDAINHKYVLDAHYQKFRSTQSTFISI